jgi:hypothetical protein
LTVTEIGSRGTAFSDAPTCAAQREALFCCSKRAFRERMRYN